MPKAVQQSGQGWWRMWEDALQKCLSMNDLLDMTALRVNVILRSTFNYEPSEVGQIK